MDAEPVIHVVDDDHAVRDSLRFLLASHGYRASTYTGAPALLAAELPAAGCVLTDFQMPDMNGLQLQAELADRRAGLPVIVMTAFGEVSLAVRAMRAGAVDFLEKPFDSHAVLEAVDRALARNKVERHAFMRAAEAARRIAGLTPREREVLDLLVAGLSSKTIARRLGTSPRTIDVHRARVFSKLGADNMADLVHLVIAAVPP